MSKRRVAYPSSESGSTEATLSGSNLSGTLIIDDICNICQRTEAPIP